MRFWRGSFLTLLMLIMTSSLVLGSGKLNSEQDQSAVQSGIANDYWPKADWKRSSPEEQGMDSEHLFKMTNYFKENQKDIHSLLVLRNGYLITEAYFLPLSKGFQACH